MKWQSEDLDTRKLLRQFVVVLICILGFLSVVSCRKKTPEPVETISEVAEKEQGGPAGIVLRALLAGTWYSSDPAALKQQFDEFFQKADTGKIDNVIALVLPHAGYQWSGQTAASALKTITKKYKRIIVIGPSHRSAMEEIISVPRATHFETPLGQIPLDTEFIQKLLKFPMVQNVPYAHQAENSIELELPILQYCQQDFRLVPIVAGQCSLETVEKVAAILKSLVDTETLVIASSDFVHYGASFGFTPFSENVPENIKELDMGAYQYIAALDAKGFLQYREKTNATICGSVPIAILLSMLGKPSEAHLVKYAASGQMTGDFSSSVSYLSIAFSGTWQNSEDIKSQVNNPGLTDEDKRQLLTLARKTITYAVQNRKVPQISELGITISDAMNSPRAAFVTLEKNDRLRGCIGDIFPQRPLYKSVLINAINACFNDTRFPQVEQNELKEITIEISALTAPQPIASPDEIRIGVDGVILSKEGRSAVFLPQVAPEQGWNVPQMLTQLSMKAGLPADAWKDGAGFQVFQAVVFGESEK